MAQDDDALAQKINNEEREDTTEDLSEVEGQTDGIPLPSRDGDADMDLDEPGGNQQNHQTR